MAAEPAYRYVVRSPELWRRRRRLFFALIRARWRALFERLR